MPRSARLKLQDVELNAVRAGLVQCPEDLRRKNPVPQMEGVFFSLREQRSHFAET